MHNPLRCALAGHKVLKKHREFQLKGESEVRLARIPDTPGPPEYPPVYNFVYPCYVCGLYINRPITIQVEFKDTIINKKSNTHHIRPFGSNQDYINWIEEDEELI